MKSAIVTKLLPCTETLPSRIKATVGRQSAVYSIHRIPEGITDAEDRHQWVAEQLAYRVFGECTLVGGYTSGGFVWCVLPKEYEAAREAVVETRLAIRRGDNHGNPHLHPYGRKVAGLTDEGGAFEYHYQKRLVAEFGGTFNAAKVGGGEA